MGTKELKRFLKTREERLVEQAYKRGLKAGLTRNEKWAKERQRKKDESRRRKEVTAAKARDLLIRRYLKGKTPSQIVKKLRKEGLSVKDFVRLAAEAGIKTRQAFSIWFSPEGAGAGIF